MYEERITQEILSTLRLAPFLYFLCGYWMLTNRQLLSNDHLHPIYSENDEPHTDHDLAMLVSKDGWVSPYWPIGAMAIFALVYYLIADKLNKIIAKHWSQARIGDSLSFLDEGLLNYWSALSIRDKKWIIKEEHYRKNALNMPMMTEE